MALNFPALYVEAWAQPRQSMRRILGLTLSERDRIIMVAITGVLFAIPVAMVFRTIEMPVGPDGVQMTAPSTFTIAVFTVGLVILGYYFTAALIKAVGAVFGGKAGYVECKTVSAWTQLIIGLANLVLLLISFVVPGALDALLRLIFTFATLYVFSSYVAEAHGFQSILKVIGVMVAMSIILSFALMPLIPAEMLQAPQ